MSDEQLRQSLTELRSELERLDAEEAEVRERLDALIAGIETRLATAPTIIRLFRISAGPLCSWRYRIPEPPPSSIGSWPRWGTSGPDSDALAQQAHVRDVRPPDPPATPETVRPPDPLRTRTCALYEALPSTSRGGEHLRPR